MEGQISFLSGIQTNTFLFILFFPHQILASFVSDEFSGTVLVGVMTVQKGKQLFVIFTSTFGLNLMSFKCLLRVFCHSGDNKQTSQSNICTMNIQ